MSETNLLTIILLAEGLVVSLLLLSLMIGLKLRKRRRKRRAVTQLLSQVEHQSEVRVKETGSFLQDIYQFQDSELKVAVDTIDKHEKVFFQKVISMFLDDDTDLMISMDATMAELVGTYKNLKPKSLEGQNNDDSKDLLKELAVLRNSNEKLKEELAITKNTMSNMIGEFGSMFGGGSDHELAKHEVVAQVKDISPNEEDTPKEVDDLNLDDNPEDQK